MKINTRKIIFIFIYVCLIFCVNVLLSDVELFRNKCILSTIFIMLGLLTNIIFVKKVFIPINIILICFVLFQFGVPMLYAMFPEYDNWYINQFSSEQLNESIKISVNSILFFALGLTITNKKMKKKSAEFLSDENRVIIFSFAKTLLIITGIIAVPLGIYVAYLGSIYGYNYIKVDSMHIYNGVTRFAQEYIVVAILLCIIFAEEEKIKKKYKLFALLYSGILILSGARTVSLALLLVLIFIENEKKSNNKNTSKNILMIFGVIMILFVGVVVAQYRFSGEFIGFNFSKIIKLVIQEMGFNFTTINFVKEFVPNKYSFKFGKTYIDSIICMIPKTLDLTGTIARINRSNPELELAKWLSDKYGNLYNFGVGYSAIAESYYNFGKFGFISIFIQAIIIGKLMNCDTNNIDTKFRKYIQYILLFDLITYPRRTFLTLVKTIEYDILLIILAIYILSKKKMRRRNE